MALPFERQESERQCTAFSERQGFVDGASRTSLALANGASVGWRADSGEGLVWSSGFAQGCRVSPGHSLETTVARRPFTLGAPLCSATPLRFQ